MTGILRRLLAILIALAIAGIVYLTGAMAGYPEALLWSVCVFLVGLWAGWPSEPLEFDLLETLRRKLSRKVKR